MTIAQGLQELLGVITTVLSRAQVPTTRMLVDEKGLGKPPAFSGKREDFHVESKNVENCVSGVFPNVRGAVAFAVQTQAEITAAAVALGALEIDDGTAAEMDGQLFRVLSTLTDGESSDVNTSAGGDRGIDSWRELRERWDPYVAGRARRLL